MIPGFTAENALAPARRRYRAGVNAVAGDATVIAPQFPPNTGGYILPHPVCMGHTLTVIAVDTDANGNVVNWHSVDEIGNCVPMNANTPT